MLTIYRLQLEKEHIKRVQEATLTTEDFGIEPTHGLFGSPEWWNHIRAGTLPVHRVKGIITRVYMEGSYNDWPTFDMRAEDGKESTWTQQVSDPDYASLYTVGRPIEIDYVVQRSRSYVAGLDPQIKEVIAIRVGE
jgi:hypothetical protein